MVPKTFKKHCYTASLYSSTLVMFFVVQFLARRLPSTTTDLCTQVADMEPGDWERYICVEAADALQPVQVRATPAGTEGPGGEVCAAPFGGRREWGQG